MRDVAPGDERASAAGENDHPDRGGRLERGHRRLEVGQDLGVDRVERRRTVDGEDRDGLPAANVDMDRASHGVKRPALVARGVPGAPRTA